ncbi:MAG: HNH endonuclease [Chloroflexi bacterium]|nr:HNH endonuclease [Chloroflexota bacterium]
MIKQWKPIPGYEELYEISNSGVIRRLSTSTCGIKGMIRKPHQLRGYNRIILHREGKARLFQVHRLVLLAFVGTPLYSSIQANHKNGNRNDNRVENLEWVTPKENREHAIKHLGANFGKANRGEHNGQSKLTESQAKEILRRYATKQISQAELARQYTVSKTCIWDLIHGRKWQYLPR